MPGPRRLALLIALVLAPVLGGVSAEPARAEGANLDGRFAPEMVFTDGMNGVSRGTALSSFRGRVVWIKFVLRDCPLCRKTLPRAQELHERWGRSGLVVLVVMYKYGPREIGAFMQQNGYSFRVGTDATGDLGRQYGLKHMPSDYVVGIDGRIVASSRAPDDVILTELGKYRLARLGAVPPELEPVRRSVWNWDYGTALRTAEAEAARPGASAQVQAVRDRLVQQSREELGARVAVAEDYERRRRVDVARTILDRVVEHFQGTSIAAEAVAARQALRARTGS